MDQLLDQIQDIARKLDDAEPASMLRETAEAIDHALEVMGDSPSYWTKLHIASACSNLWQSALRRSDDRLRMALYDLWYAFLPEGTYNEDFSTRNTAIDKMTPERFTKAAKGALLEAVCA
jgi:hypothetical protein